MDTLIIGIAGGSGSGKSTLTKLLRQDFQNEVTVLNHDDYYLAQDDIPFEERCKRNYDHPDAFETTLLISHLQALKAGQEIDCPVYDYTQQTRSAQTRRVSPAPVILVDGILILENPALRALFDIKIYVDTDADVRVLRRIVRDTKKRGRSLDSVIEQYLATVKPMHDAFVEPSKKFADFIIPMGGRNPVVLDMIQNRLREHLQSGNR
ncbi:MAG: uridine kinase [Clostridia bacterium]|nr:uridine kinase [Clostridia bacterium]